MAEVFTKPTRRIRNMVAKELRLIVKDKVALMLIFMLPAALIGMIWYVTNSSGMGGAGFGGSSSGTTSTNTTQTTGSTNTTTTTTEVGQGTILGLVDLDTTRTYNGPDLSENYTDTLRNFVDTLIIYNSTDQAWHDLYEKKIDGYVVIPDGFEANLSINEPTYVEVHVDASDFIKQSTVEGVVSASTIVFRVSKLWIRSEVFPNMVIDFAPGGGYVESVFGGFIIVFSAYLGIAMTAAQSIVGDIPLRRMLLTPTNRLEVITAKVIGYLIIGFFQSLLLITLWIVVFDLSMNTSFITLVIVMSMIALTGSATGLLISSVAGTRLQANQMFLFVLFGSIILAGFFVDVGVLDEILPLNQGMKLLIGTAFKGLSLFEIWQPVVKLLGFSLLAILAATFIFGKKPTLG
jgi:ABC-2 type transport system permease protein